MFEEITVVDQITVDENNNLLVRRVKRILKDSVKISETYERVCYAPNSDVSSEDDKVKAVAVAVWKI